MARSRRLSAFIWIALLIVFLVLEVIGLVGHTSLGTASQTARDGLRLIPTPVRWIVRGLLLLGGIALGVHLGLDLP